MQNFDRLERWSRHRYFGPTLIGIGILSGMLGYYVACVLPAQQVTWARNSAEREVAHALANIEKARALSSTMAWFSRHYTEEVNHEIDYAVKAVQSGDESATALIKSSEGDSWRTKLKKLRAARQIAEEADHKTAEALSNMEAAIERRTRARSKFVELSNTLVTVRIVLSRTQQLVVNQSPRFPSWYGRDWAQRIAQIWSDQKQIEDISKRASERLPPDDSTSNSGDPDTALEEIDAAGIIGARTVSAVERLESDLNDLVRQAETAVRSVTQAEAEITAADQELSKRKRGTGYWFKQATDALDASRQRTEAARHLLTSVAGGEQVPDLPAAHRAALEASSLSNTIREKIESEMAAAKRAFARRDVLAAKLPQLASISREAHAALETLETYHHHFSWDGVALYKSEFDAPAIARIAGKLQSANHLLDFKVQQFTQAERLCSEGIEEIESRLRKAQAIDAARQELEAARLSFGSELSNAESVLNAERRMVEKYGSYSSHASSAFAAAQAAVREARTLAQARRFNDAVNSCRTAVAHARGTGQEAYNAYQASLEEDDDDDDNDTYVWYSGGSNSSGSSSRSSGSATRSSSSGSGSKTYGGGSSSGGRRASRNGGGGSRSSGSSSSRSTRGSDSRSSRGSDSRSSRGSDSRFK